MADRYLASRQQWEGTLGDSGRADVDIKGVSRKVGVIVEVFERRLACLDVGSRLVGLDRSLFLHGSDSARLSDLLDHGCFTGLEETSVEIRDLLVSRRLPGLLQECARLVIDEVRPEKLVAGPEGKTSASVRYVAGALALILPFVWSEISVRLQ